MSEDNSQAALMNSAFVFVKPHANTEKVQGLVRSRLTDEGISILSEGDISGEEIDEKKLIDQHYYAIASKATILPAKEMPVPESKFEEAFGETWEKVLAEGRACNAMEACEHFGCDTAELNEAWKDAKLTKFGGGFYCGSVTVGGKPAVYVFNAFFMAMRAKFVGEGASIHYYEVQWEESKMSWGTFRGTFLGPTNPADGPVGSIRRTILDSYDELGLKSEPNNSDNGVHASASPFEGLAEKANWLQKEIGDDSFGKALLTKGFSVELVKEWSIDPRVVLPGGEKGSVFDALEDMDVSECIEKLAELKSLN